MRFCIPCRTLPLTLLQVIYIFPCFSSLSLSFSTVVALTRCHPRFRFRFLSRSLSIPLEFPVVLARASHLYYPPSHTIQVFWSSSGTFFISSIVVVSVVHFRVRSASSLPSPQVSIFLSRLPGLSLSQTSFLSIYLFFSFKFSRPFNLTTYLSRAFPTLVDRYLFCFLFSHSTASTGI